MKDLKIEFRLFISEEPHVKLEILEFLDGLHPHQEIDEIRNFSGLQNFQTIEEKASWRFLLNLNES